MFNNEVTKKDKIYKFYKEWRGIAFFIIAILIIRSSFFNWYNIPSSSMNPTLIKGDIVTVNMLAYDVMLPFSKISLKKISDPEYADIVGVFIADQRYVKRIIAKPNDKIKMVDNIVYINGVKLTQTEFEMDLDFLPLVHGSNKIKFKSYIEKHGDFTYPIVKAYGFEDPAEPSKISSFPSSFLSQIITDFEEVTVPEGKYFAMGDNRNLSKDSRVLGFVDRENIIGKINSVAFNYASLWTPEISVRIFNPID